MYTRCRRWRCGQQMPTTASCGDSVESVEIDNLMGRILAVMVVPYPPGIPLIMPGERITKATKSIQDYLLYAREFDRKFPGFETDIHGLRFVSGRRRATLSRGLRHRGRARMIPRDVMAPRSPFPFTSCSRSSRSSTRATSQTKELLDQICGRDISKSKSCETYDRDVSEDASVGAYIGTVEGGRRRRSSQVRPLGSRTWLQDAALGARRLRTGSPRSRLSS